MTEQPGPWIDDIPALERLLVDVERDRDEAIGKANEYARANPWLQACQDLTGTATVLRMHLDKLKTPSPSTDGQDEIADAGVVADLSKGIEAATHAINADTEAHDAATDAVQRFQRPSPIGQVDADVRRMRQVFDQERA